MDWCPKPHLGRVRFAAGFFFLESNLFVLFMTVLNHVGAYLVFLLILRKHQIDTECDSMQTNDRISF